MDFLTEKHSPESARTQESDEFLASEMSSPQSMGASMPPPDNSAIQLQKAVNSSPSVTQLKSYQATANASPQVAQLKATQEAANRSTTSSPLDSLPVQFKMDNPSPGETMQLAQADVDYQVGAGGVRHVAGDAIGRGGIGGVSHSEQGVWARVQGPILAGITAGNHVSVTFDVDTSICGGCSPWFENTVWTAMNAATAAAGGTFTLNVVVNGSTVQVTGANTIWPNEIADAPTWGRLNDYEKMDRFINENRDEDGEIMQAGYSDHVTGIHDELDTIVSSRAVSEADISTCFNDGIQDAVRLQIPRYNFRDAAGNEDQAAMRAHIMAQNDVSLFHAISSGRIGAIPEWDFEADRQEERRNWMQKMTAIFLAWAESYIELNFDEYEIQGENPHV